VHKGLFPPSVEKQFPHLVGYSHVGDVGKAAKDWPDLNFIIYHSAYRWVGGATPAEGRAQWERTGRIEWVNDLAEIPQQYGVTNVYGDLGQIFAWTAAAEPRLCAFIMGSLVKGLGADHVVWGTDSLWTGAPQWQIESLRRLEIPRTCRRNTASRRSARRRPGEDRRLRRQQRAPLPAFREATGRGAHRPLRRVQDHLRQARRRPHQPVYGYIRKRA